SLSARASARVRWGALGREGRVVLRMCKRLVSVKRALRLHFTDYTTNGRVVMPDNKNQDQGKQADRGNQNQGQESDKDQDKDFGRQQQGSRGQQQGGNKGSTDVENEGARQVSNDN